MNMTVEEMVSEVRTGLRDKLGLRGKTLAAQLRKGGRLLPRRIRYDARYLALVVTLADNPKLVRMIDQAKVKQAHRNILAHLNEIDLAAQRRDTALTIAAAIAFALLVTGVMVIFVLWWRDLI